MDTKQSRVAEKWDSVLCVWAHHAGTRSMPEGRARHRRLWSCRNQSYMRERERLKLVTDQFNVVWFQFAVRVGESLAQLQRLIRTRDAGILNCLRCGVVKPQFPRLVVWDRDQYACENPLEHIPANNKRMSGRLFFTSSISHKSRFILPRPYAITNLRMSCPLSNANRND